MSTRASPFDLTNESAYLQWRSEKLGFYSPLAEHAVCIQDPERPSAEEVRQIVRHCERTNWVIYYCPQIGDDPEKIRALAAALGLRHMDQNLCADQSSISAIQVREDSGRHAGYIPYTNKPLSWHTDGYYNVETRKINAILMHCVAGAAEGGHNCLLDPEIVYLLLRDLNPEWVSALMAPDAMTIPENRDGDVLRLAVTGPVFSVGPGGYLHMRYTARTRSVEWKKEACLQAAVAALGDILAAQTPYHFNYAPSAGYGIISNNCLHNRSAFQDDPKLGKMRLIYRARYYERVGYLGPL